MNGPVCGKCGNDGSKGGLYLTIDAAWNLEAAAWVLEAREDNGGMELDCLACDHRTPVDDKDETGLHKSGFPYGLEVQGSASTAASREGE